MPHATAAHCGAGAWPIRCGSSRCHFGTPRSYLGKVKTQSPLLLDTGENHSPSPIIAFTLPLSYIEHALFVVFLPFHFKSLPCTSRLSLQLWPNHTRASRLHRPSIPSRVLNSSLMVLMRQKGRCRQSQIRNGRCRSVKAVVFNPPLTLQLTKIQSPNPEDRALSPGIRSDFKSSRRNSNDAPESDGPWSPRPQTYLSSDNETLKEVNQKSATPAAAPQGEKGRPRRRRRMLWILIALIAFLVIAIGVGVGVGVGVTRNKGSTPARYRPF